MANNKLKHNKLKSLKAKRAKIICSINRINLKL
jgi:uncharacterized membrane protein YqhA